MDMGPHLSRAQIERINELEVEKTKRDFAGFKEATTRGICWICKDALESFNDAKPCLHWLLCPPGFRKKHFPLITKEFDIQRIESYLRWTAAASAPFVGINDIKEEHSGKNIIDVTVKHGDLEWSISLSPSCFEGKHGGQPPHYHFQMRRGGKSFIDYGNYHINLNDYEKWIINVRLGKHPQIKHTELYGAGIDSAMKEFQGEELLKHMRKAEDESKAPFQLQTIIMADEGQSISGDEVVRLIEESKRTGIPMATLSKKLKGVKTRVIITPGDGIPKAASRSPGRTRRKKSKH